jgi:hypothetical protein
MENLGNMSTGDLDLTKMRMSRSKAESTTLRMNNTAAIVPREELQFI